MKTITLTFIFGILTSLVNGQEFIISIAPTLNDAYYFRGISEGPNYKVHMGYNVTLDYYFQSDKKFNTGLGLSYQYSPVLVDTYIDGINDPEPFARTACILSVSFNLRYSLKQNFYLFLHPTLNTQTNLKFPQRTVNQSGFGLSFGFGENIFIKDGLLLNIEPRLWIHNIIPFEEEEFPYRLTTLELNLGLVFGKKTD